MLPAGFAICLCACTETTGEDDPFGAFTRAWRDDPIWHDGQAEMAVYDATRTIYGSPRNYIARVYTNKELADKHTKTKSAAPRGRPVFKHHARDDIPTENYTYHYSTMCYVGSDDLKSLKIDMGSSEDCGATFKQFVNHAGTCQWRQSSYFPDEGHRNGAYEPDKRFVFHDALSLVLRGYPFNRPRPIRVMLLADQTTTKWSAPKPRSATIHYVGPETLTLPIGGIAAHQLRVSYDDATENQAGHHYWFAADATAPRLNVMVQYEGPGGVTYKLREQKRWAYWKRPAAASPN